MPSTTGTDYKNNNVCLYSTKIIYEVIIILYLVSVNIKKGMKTGCVSLWTKKRDMLV